MRKYFGCCVPFAVFMVLLSCYKPQIPVKKKEQPVVPVRKLLKKRPVLRKIRISKKQRELLPVPQPKLRCRYRLDIRFLPDGSQVKHGKDWGCWRNGLWKWKRNWISGAGDGKWVEWFKNGGAKSLTFYRHGTADGKHIEWYRNGKVKVFSLYRNGKRNGIYKLWNKKGILRVLGRYRVGQKDGAFQQWSSTGVLQLLANYKRGELHGKHLVLKGSSSRETHYWNGKKHGVEIQWSREGMLRSETYYRYGKKHGRSIRWSSVGKLSLISYFEGGKKHGLHARYYRNGRLSQRLFFVEGRRCGAYQYFRQQGDIYKKGELRRQCPEFESSLTLNWLLSTSRAVQRAKRSYEKISWIQPKAILMNRTKILERKSKPRRANPRIKKKVNPCVVTRYMEFRLFGSFKTSTVATVWIQNRRSYAVNAVAIDRWGTRSNKALVVCGGCLRKLIFSFPRYIAGPFTAECN